MTNVLKVLIVLVILFTALFLFPVFTILSLNTLFGLEIGVTFTTWFAAFWVNYVLFGHKIFGE